MIKQFPLWKYILIITITIFGLLFAAPNLYGEDPSVQVSPGHSGIEANGFVLRKIQSVLEAADVKTKSLEQDNGTILARFYDTNTQLKAKDIIKASLGEDYTVALNLAPLTPGWLERIGADPMKLGLDLRGGVSFLLDVDINGVIKRREEGLIRSISEDLRAKKIRYAGITSKQGGGIVLRFRNAKTRDGAYTLIRRNNPELLLSKNMKNGVYNIAAQVSSPALNDIRQYTIEQTMTILRNRVNELGVAEAVVQQQGSNRVSVDLPGIQDSARAKQILGGTATLEFRMVDVEHDVRNLQAGMVPIGSQLYDDGGRPILLKNQVILSGDSITHATSGVAEDGTPSVNIRLGGGGESLFNRVTRQNVGKPMAIVFVETKTDKKLIDGEIIKSRRKVERVISVATIRSALGTNFQITGLSEMNESRNLALLLRAGALPAAIDPVEERTVGPTLGMENIQRGILSLEVGMFLVVLLMGLYYRFFGMVANFALVMNLVLIVAILSFVGATLTLPGIAGIVLTVGMAVDANVLIFERIREELRNGMSPLASINAGYERAFVTIVDANVTTLIVAIVLFGVGTGPIKGFAVTLIIGLLTSMLTAITFTRGIISLIYTSKSTKTLSIGHY